jgi:hypothetical protein
MKTNQKNFTLIQRVSKNLYLYLSNFPYTISLLATIFVRMKLVAALSATINQTATILMGKMRLVASTVIGKTAVASVKLGIIRISATAMALKNMSQTVSFGFSHITAQSRATLWSSVIIKNLTPITANLIKILGFFKLYNYDPNTLATYDASELGTMDYVIET